MLLPLLEDAVAMVGSRRTWYTEGRSPIELAVSQAVGFYTLCVCVCYNNRVYKHFTNSTTTARNNSFCGRNGRAYFHVKNAPVGDSPERIHSGDIDAGFLMFALRIRSHSVLKCRRRSLQ